MTVRLSTGLRKAMLGNIVLLGSEATYTLVNGGASAKTITSSLSNFITKGFFPGMNLTLAGCTTAGNDASYAITAVAAGTLSFAVGNWTQAEAFAAATTGTGDNGGGFGEIFDYSVGRIYSGSPPASADDAETGTLLVEISDTSQTFVPVTGTYGLRFQMITDEDGYVASILSKKASQTWSGVAIAAGTAGYMRLYDKHRITGQSYTSRRIDLAVATSGAQVTIPSVSIAIGATVPVTSAEITMPY